MKLLEGKTIAITGGGGGLSRCYALAMTRAGAAVAVSDVDQKAAQATTDAIVKDGGRAITVQADVTKAADVERLLDRTESELGPLDVMLSVAGIFPRVALVDMTEEVWDRVIAINLRSVYLCARAAIRRMLPRKRGIVLSTASGTGIRGQPKGSAYSASKAAIIGFTRAVSLELKDTGVRINCFGPGATDTPLWRVGKSEEDIKRLLAAGYVYQPDEFSNVVVFLASDLSAPLNGEFISRDLHR
ncbi:MAG TPA: SDR family oxidoreductase [Burkholderiales bacterium]|jgi:NAD(P)-dependent dehydrogenase (short-subunit alcohol dehydrogenase family)|nr:SDR family oxidoreductase [Burkholderiales bacterium]